MWQKGKPERGHKLQFVITVFTHNNHQYEQKSLSVALRNAMPSMQFTWTKINTNKYKYVAKQSASTGRSTQTWNTKAGMLFLSLCTLVTQCCALPKLAGWWECTWAFLGQIKRPRWPRACADTPSLCWCLNIGLGFQQTTAGEPGRVIRKHKSAVLGSSHWHPSLK